MIRSGALPRVTFDVVSPSELKAWRERDYKREQVQDVPDICEMVGFYEEQIAAHVYRKGGDGAWSFEAAGGSDAILTLPSVGISIPRGEIYCFAELAEQPRDE